MASQMRDAIAGRDNTRAEKDPIVKKIRTLVLAAGCIILAGCGNLTQDQRFAAGGLAGAAAGLATADALKSNKSGKIVGTLAGAAIGSTYAANTGGSRW